MLFDLAPWCWTILSNVAPQLSPACVKSAIPQAQKHMAVEIHGHGFLAVTFIFMHWSQSVVQLLQQRVLDDCLGTESQQSLLYS